MVSYWFSTFISYFLISCINTETLRQIYFTPGDHANVYINMRNSPPASSYAFYAQKDDGTYSALNISGIYDENANPEFSHELNEKDDNIVLYIYLIYSYNTTCATRPVLQFKKRNDRGTNLPDCLTPSGCTVDVKWNKDCDAVPNTNEDEQTITLRVLQFGPKMKLNETRIYSEGERFIFDCSTDHSNTYLIWRHTKDKYVISVVTGNVGYSLKLNLTLWRFDDDTSLVCLVYKSASELDRSKEIFLKWNGNPSLGKEINYGGTLVEPIPTNQTYYKVGEAKQLMCSISSNHFTSWYRIKNNKIDFHGNPYSNNTLSKYILQLNMTKDDNGTSYVCYSFKSSDMGKVLTRIISRLTNFMIEPGPGTPDTAVPGANSLEKKSKNQLIYFSIGGIVVAVILCVGFWKISSIYCQHTPTLEVETYACPTTVRYVDLQALSTDNTNRVVNRDDTPYAQIIGVLEPSNK